MIITFNNHTVTDKNHTIPIANLIKIKYYRAIKMNACQVQEEIMSHVYVT